MRYSIIDDLRALAIINMVLYHTLFDIVYIFGINIPWFMGNTGFIWEQYICWSFILIAGFCQGLSKHSLKEGIIVSFWGIVITVITYIVPLGIHINFGVLTFIGLAILLIIPLKRSLNKISPILGLLVSFSLFLIFRNSAYGYLGFGNFNFYKLPDFLYESQFGWFMTLLGFPSPGFSSADYFPLIPWFFLFITGYFIYHFLKKSKKLDLLKGNSIPLLTYISKHSLLIYLLHQPIVFAILYIYFVIKGTV